MTEWEVIRRQVAIGGFVRNNTEEGMGAVSVRALRKSDGRVLGRCTTQDDGSYYVLDLPDGEYTVSAEAKAATAEGDAKVLRDGEGNLQIVRLDLRFKVE
jgi:Carboxypeptidase regulatory-like domain